MTTTALRADILDRLEEVQTQCPELRFGQMIATIGMLCEDEFGHSLWDVDNAEFAASIERFAADVSRRTSPSDTTVPSGSI